MIEHAALFAVIMSALPMCLCCPCLCLSSLHNTIQLIDCSSLACSFFSLLVCLCRLLLLSWTSAVGQVCLLPRLALHCLRCPIVLLLLSQRHGLAQSSTKLSRLVLAFADSASLLPFFSLPPELGPHASIVRPVAYAAAPTEPSSGSRYRSLAY